jgi:hypothetical protein
MADIQFQFVVSDGPQISKDPALRTVIRKQAMRNVGNARKQRGSRGQAKARRPLTPASTETTDASMRTANSGAPSSSQPHTGPIHISAPDLELEILSEDELVSLELIHQKPVSKEVYMAWVPPLSTNPTHAYEALRAKYYFDVQDLYILTGFNINRNTLMGLQQNPELVASLLGHRMCSYLTYVPERYGATPYLTAVVDCVTAKAHSVLYPPNAVFSKQVMRMYQKALRAIQQAIADEEACRDNDLLCAVQLLSIHEVRANTTFVGNEDTDKHC